MNAGVRGGFSLVELMVVIGIIVVFAALVVNLRSISSGADRQTQVVLAQMKLIADEYQLQVGVSVDPEDGEDATSSIEVFVRAAKQLPVTLQMLKKLGKTVYIDDDNDTFEEVLDGWGRPLMYFRSNVDGTDEIMDYPHPFFASGGEDGDIGDINEAHGSAADNLYSFNIE